MPNPRNYWTSPRPEGWAVQREGSSRATSVHGTQSEAWNEAKSRARESSGEAYLQGQNGQIRERNTYGHDPRRSKG